MSKYEKLYDDLMKRARDCPLYVDYEKHHVVPRSLGGSNDNTNIVKLTYREHFLAHWLLTKFTSGVAKQKMCLALSRMTHRSGRQNKVISGWQYELARKANVRGLRNNRHLLGKKFSEETRRRMSRAKLGKKFTADHRKKISVSSMGNKSMTGRTHSAETKEKLAAWHRGRTLSVETRDKIAAYHLGKKASEETRAKMRAAHARRRSV